MTKGGSLFGYSHFQSSAFFLLLLPRGETLLNFRRISRAIPRALTDLDLSPSPDEVPIWDSEYYRLPVTISVGRAFQPSITFPFAQRPLRTSVNACLKIGLANRSPLRVEDLLGTGFIWER